MNISILKNEDNVVWLKIDYEFYLFINNTLICHIDKLNNVEFLNQDKHSSKTMKYTAEFLKQFKQGEITNDD